MSTKIKNQDNLAKDPIDKLLIKFAVPAIIANLVSALYNIVDQIFIGRGVGYLGNAATNVAFPVTTICLAIGLLIGVGSASNLNLELGKGNTEKARKIVGTAFGTLIILGLIIAVVVRVFLEPLIVMFGATDQILDYAMTYVGITSFGIPFFLISTGGNAVIRADKSSAYSMVAMVSGAVLNIILDPIFIFGLDMGMAGAAYATVISQIVSATIVLAYLPRFKSFKLVKKEFIPDKQALIAIVSLGLTPMFFQLSATIVQIASNNLLNIYGAESIYGSEIPIAVAGIVAKIYIIFTAVIMGVIQGAQPILGFNYGAKKYSRVRKTYNLVAKTSIVISIIAFLGFELFPREIVGLFGSGNELYFTYAEKYLRVFLFCTFLNGLQIVSSIFFSSIGQAKKGAFLALTRQLLILLPLTYLFAITTGVDGIMFAGPIADFISFIITMTFVYYQFRDMPKTDME